MQWLLLILLVPYICILLKIHGGLLRVRPFNKAQVPSLFVSVVVACRNEEVNLPALLRDISEQDYDPFLFELIIIDDNSTDSTFGTASRFPGIRNLRVLKSKGKGKKQAIRTGIEASSGKVIVTTDADCRMPESWLSTLAAFYIENNPDMVICPVKLETGHGFLHKFQELEFLSLQGITAGTAHAGCPVMCNGANLLFTRQVYDDNTDNLHDEIPSGDDVFLLHSIKKMHGRIMWLESGDAMVTTCSRGKFSSYIRQRVRWISKAGSYSDGFTSLLAIVTFVTILLEWSLLIAGIFNPLFLLILLTAIILKSIPDLLILRNTGKRYGRPDLMKVFLPSALIYPFYVLIVALGWVLIRGSRFPL